MVVNGRVTVKAGELKFDWAIERPSASSMITAKSRVSPTIEENEVRTRVASVSSMMLMRRFHWTSSVIGSTAVVAVIGAITVMPVLRPHRR